MILDHIEYIEDVDVETGKIIIRERYQIDVKYVCDIHEDKETKDNIKIELAKSIQELMVKDLSGYFHDSFTDEDIFYITRISHTTLNKMRQLAEFTKYMSVEQVKKILSAYAMLVDLGFASKESTND